MKNTLRGAFELEIEDKKFDCLLNLNAFRILTQKFGIKLSKLESELAENPLELMPQLAYCGCLNSAMRKQKKFEVEFDYFAAILLDGPEAIEYLSERITEVFAPEEKGKGKNEKK